MLYWTTPRETEAGSAGEHPVKGYLGGAHREDGTGAATRAHPNIHHLDRPLMPHKTQQQQHGNSTRKGHGHTQPNSDLAFRPNIPTFADDIHWRAE